MASTSLSNSKLINEVRDFIPDIDSSKIPDSTITQKHDRVVEPYLDSKVSNPDQTDFDNAAIALTAELSFKSWLAKTSRQHGEDSASIDPKEYKANLVEQVEMVMSRLGVRRPSQGPVAFTERTDGMMRE